MENKHGNPIIVIAENSLPDGSKFLAQWIFNEVNLDFFSLPEEF
ncbi:hypothetical protein [Porphyromonas macacae]|nr:hypothetical protein [Porphyromonas macacae]